MLTLVNPRCCRRPHCSRLPRVAVASDAATVVLTRLPVLPCDHPTILDALLHRYLPHTLTHLPTQPLSHPRRVALIPPPSTPFVVRQAALPSESAILILTCSPSPVTVARNGYGNRRWHPRLITYVPEALQATRREACAFDTVEKLYATGVRPQHRRWASESEQLGAF